MVKRFLYTLFLTFTSILLFGQFDLYNLNPVSKNPSFVGSTGKNRIIAELAVSELIEKAGVSYDVFSKKIGGGWGINTSYLYWNGVVQWEQNLAYSPKITLRESKYTWAPSLKVSHKTNALLDTISDTRSPIFNNLLSITLGLNVNTDHSLAGGYFEYSPESKQIETSLQYCYRFNKNPSSTTSSTISLFTLFHNDNRYSSNYYFESRNFNPPYPNQLPPKDRLNLVNNNRELLIGSAYGIRFKKLVFNTSLDITLWERFRNENYIFHQVLGGTFYPSFGLGYHGKIFQCFLKIDFDRLNRLNNFGQLNTIIGLSFRF